MGWNECVIDASMGYRPGFVFCPVEMNESGEVTSIVTGMNYFGSPPPTMRLLGVWHEDGPGAANAFFEQHKDEIIAFMEGR